MKRNLAKNGLICITAALIGLTCGLLTLYFRTWSQYAPLLLALALSSLAPIGLLIKPHIALPLLVYRARRVAWIIVFVIAGVSLLVYPPWPIKWLSELRPYQGMTPLLLPGGFVLLLAGLRWREQGARLLLLSAVMPLRGIYDQVNLLMIPQSLRALLVVLIINWLAYLAPLTVSIRLDVQALILINFYAAMASILVEHHVKRIQSNTASTVTVL